MAKNWYVGASAVAHKAKKMYVGVNGVAHNVKKAYIGDANGKARLCWSGGAGGFVWMSTEGNNYASSTPQPTMNIRSGSALSANAYDTNFSISSVYATQNGAAKYPRRSTPITHWNGKWWILHSLGYVAYSTNLSTWTTLLFETNRMPIGIYPTDDYLIIYAKVSNTATTQNTGHVYKVDKSNTVTRISNYSGTKYSMNCSPFGNHVYLSVGGNFSEGEGYPTTIIKVSTSGTRKTSTKYIGSMDNAMVIKGTSSILFLYNFNLAVYIVPNTSTDTVETITQIIFSFSGGVTSPALVTGCYWKGKYYLYGTGFMFVSADECRTWTFMTTSGINDMHANLCEINTDDDEKIYRPNGSSGTAGYKYSTDGITWTNVILGNKLFITYVAPNKY